MARVAIFLGVSGLDELLEYVRDTPLRVQRAQEALDRALDATAERSRALAHVHAGALRESQTHSSSHEINGWEGQISYSSRGAAWEIQRGGEHAAFIDSLSGLSEESFEEAINQAF